MYEVRSELGNQLSVPSGTSAESTSRGTSIRRFSTLAWCRRLHLEGIVIRSPTADTFEVKPRHAIDAAVIGCTRNWPVRRAAGAAHDPKPAPTPDVSKNRLKGRKSRQEIGGRPLYHSQ